MAYKFRTSKQRSALMKKIRSTETTPEIVFRKILWAEGFRYRKNNNKLPGTPDICMPKHELVIFIDGEFWHGYNWKKKKRRIKTNRKYWIPKIEKNMERDKKNAKLLKKEGWKVVRFWEHEIKKNPNKCLDKVKSLI